MLLYQTEFSGVVSSIKTLRNKVKTQFPSKGNYDRFIDVFLSVTKTNRLFYQKYVNYKLYLFKFHQLESCIQTPF